MEQFEFKKAERKNRPLRLALLGPTGSGKTLSALRIAHGIGGRIGVIDSEHESSGLYADFFGDDAYGVLPLVDHSVNSYIRALKAAADAGISVCIIDSLSHAWSGKNGILEFVDSKKNQGNGFAAWRDASPLHAQLVQALLDYPGHLIVTMRTKMEYVVEPDERGKMVPRKVGLQPVQREGLEYEFDIVGDIDLSHTLVFSKTRCFPLDGRTFQNPGPEVAEILRDWLGGGQQARQAYESRTQTTGSRSTMPTPEQPIGQQQYGQQQYAQQPPQPPEPAPEQPDPGAPLFAQIKALREQLNLDADALRNRFGNPTAMDESKLRWVIETLETDLVAAREADPPPVQQQQAQPQSAPPNNNGAPPNPATAPPNPATAPPNPATAPPNPQPAAANGTKKRFF